MLFIRFVILVIRYNLKTSFYITCIGLVAGYFWYRHLIDLTSMYRSILFKLPFLHSLGMDAAQMGSLNRQMAIADLKLGENARWYNPGQIIYYALRKGIVFLDSETGIKYYIDPISMFISNLHEPTKSNVASIYYQIYQQIIPKIFDICSKLWNQLSGICAYTIMTRLGKRYCPYLIRWHWTFILVIGMIEQMLISFIYRLYYFQSFVLIPKLESYDDSIDSNLFLQINLLNAVLAGVVLTHFGLTIFGLFHAIWGQYFYFPFLVENTEIHIGRRPKDSIYSGGQTARQNPEEKKVHRGFPKLWFGWFGRGSKGNSQLVSSTLKLMKKLFKRIRKQFRG